MTSDDDDDFGDPDETVADGYRIQTRSLSSGDNVIYVKVTAGDGTTTKTYTVTVTRVGNGIHLHAPGPFGPDRGLDRDPDGGVGYPIQLCTGTACR